LKHKETVDGSLLLPISILSPTCAHNNQSYAWRLDSHLSDECLICPVWDEIR